MEEQIAKHVAIEERTQMEIIELQKQIRCLTNAKQDMSHQLAELQSCKGDLEIKAATAEARCIVLEDQLHDSKEQVKGLRDTLNSNEERGKEAQDMSSLIEQLRNTE